MAQRHYNYCQILARQRSKATIEKRQVLEAMMQQKESVIANLFQSLAFFVFHT